MSYMTSFLRTENPDPEGIPSTLLDLIKAHTRIPVSYTGWDTMLTNYARSAESLLEKQAEIAIRSQKWTMALSQFKYPRGGFTAERLTLRPITAIDSISYYEPDNNTPVEWDDANYSLIDGNPPKLYIADSVVIPTTQCRPDAWQVVMSAGDDVYSPEAETFIATIAACWFRNPEDMGKSPSDTASKRLTDNLIDACRWRLYP